MVLRLLGNVWKKVSHFACWIWRFSQPHRPRSADVYEDGSPSSHRARGTDSMELRALDGTHERTSPPHFTAPRTDSPLAPRAELRGAATSDIPANSKCRPTAPRRFRFRGGGAPVPVGDPRSGGLAARLGSQRSDASLKRCSNPWGI